jgi:hypothetical protein
MILYLTGASELLTNALAAADFNGDGVSDIAVATTGRCAPGRPPCRFVKTAVPWRKSGRRCAQASARPL